MLLATYTPCPPNEKIFRCPWYAKTSSATYIFQESALVRFTALLHHLNVDLLRDSFYALQRKASPGVDGVTWKEYESGLEDRLVDLFTTERIGQSLQDESSYRRPTGGNVRWASRR